MVRWREREAVSERLAGLDGLGVGEALAVAAAENVHGNRQLIAAQVRIAGDFIGIDIDQFDDPVGIRAGG